MKVKIFQVKDIDNCDYAFRPYNQNCFNPSHYKEVYSFDTPPCLDCDAEDLVEHLFTMFQHDNPRLQVQHPTFTGHSMSVSDVVKVDSQCYYVLPVGLARLNDNIL